MKTHIFFFLVLIAATIVRFHGISQNMIFIGDQGRDFFVAKDMAENGNIPLLGIPSSVPRFKQGPLYIYFLAVTYWISNGSVLATGILAASFGIAAVVGVYLLSLSYMGRKTALFASLIVALSPMMILHSRMPYHVNPIPLCIVFYIWQILRLYEGKKWASLGAGLGFALVFQFELAAFPLLLLIPITILVRNWTIRTLTDVPMQLRKIIRSPDTLMAGIGVAVGLIPQIIFDFTHGFTQVGGFIVWVGYKIVTAVLPFTRNSLTDSSTPLKFKELITLFLSIFTQNGIKLDQLFWLGLIIISVVYVLRRWRIQTSVVQLTTLGFLLLAIGLLFHRVPSEAYMPLFIVPVSIVIANLLGNLSLNFRVPLLTIVILSLGLSLLTLKQRNFFLLSPFESDWSTYRFGPSIATQHMIVNVLFALSPDHCVQLVSKERDETFPTLYNHLEYLIAIDARNQKDGECVPFLIDRPDYARTHWESSRLQTHIDMGAYWIVSLQEKKVYARR